MIMLITSFVFMACEKEEADNNTDNNTSANNENNSKSGERYEIKYFLDTSPDTINTLKAKDIQGTYDFDQNQNGNIVDVGFMTWDLASLGDVLVQELDSNYMVLEMQDGNQYDFEINIVESSPEVAEFEMPLSDDKTLHYTMTDTEGELPIIGENLEEGQIISYGELGKVCPCVIVTGAAMIVSSAVVYCATNMSTAVEQCHFQGMCASRKACGADCFCDHNCPGEACDDD